VTAKQRIIAYISGLPDSLSEEEIEEHLRAHHKIQAGIQSAKEGPLVDNEDLPELMDQWLDEE